MTNQNKKTSLLVMFGISVGLFLLSQFIYSFNLNHDLYVDELYHLLSAQSVYNNGTLGLADGHYVRAELYTRSIGFLFGVFGESVNVARMSSSILMGLFVVGVFCSLRRIIGFNEALLTSVVLLVLPSTIYLAQFVRFYAAHELFFWLGTMGVFTLVTGRLSAASFSIVTGFTCLLIGLAYHMQIITLLGFSAVLSWVFMYLAYQWLFISERGRLESIILGLMLASGILVLLYLVFSGKGLEKWTEFRYAQPWSADNKDNVAFYLKYFRYQFPTFLTLFPVACIVALYVKPKPAFFFMWVFCFGVVVFSLGGMKDERYVIHLMPFAVAIWAICICAVTPKLLVLIRNFLSELPFLKSKTGAVNVIAFGAIFIMSFFALVNNHAFPIIFHTLNGQQYRHEIGDWGKTYDDTLQIVKSADVVLTTNELESQYYFNRFDFNFSSNRLLESSDGYDYKVPNEFTLDPRTGRPVISTMDSLELVLNCYHKGVFLGDARKWYKKGKALGAEGKALLESSAESLEVNSDARLIVYTWQREDVYSLNQCSKLYQFTPYINN